MQISKSPLVPLPLLLLAALVNFAGAQVQQQQLPPQQVAPGQTQGAPSAAGAQLQAQLSQLQAQAQRQLGQLNGLMLGAVNSTKYSNVLEAISSVGKAIHQQISQATNPNHVNIVTSSSQGGATFGLGESANNKKNEYQSIVVTDAGSSLQPPSSSSQSSSNSSSSAPQTGGPNANYREQGELLRQEIVRRAGQLQQVVASSMDLLKNNGDLIVRRLLEQMNVRLDQAKAKADKIINEPTTNEVALKALGTINLGLNNLNNIIGNIVNRLDQANREAQQLQQTNQLAGAAAGQQQQAGIQQRAQSPVVQSMGQLPQIMDTNRFKANLHQLSQQFQQALNGSTLHQQLALIRAQRLQQLQQQQLLNPLSPASSAQLQPQQQQQQQTQQAQKQSAVQ